MEMGEQQRMSAGRRSSGLLTNAPASQGGEARALREALKKLSDVTRAISANLRHVNANLERILMDKEDIEELEAMLVSQPYPIYLYLMAGLHNTFLGSLKNNSLLVDQEGNAVAEAQ